jgi:hypothetical protein
MQGIWVTRSSPAKPSEEQAVDAQRRGERQEPHDEEDDAHEDLPKTDALGLSARSRRARIQVVTFSGMTSNARKGTQTER